MFVRVKRSGRGEQKHEYLQIVESRREGAKVRQKVLATLGRRDALTADGTLDNLIRSLTKFSSNLRVIEHARRENLHAHRASSWGPALVFSRLWEQQGLPEILASLADGRRFGFDVERTCFAMALQRLMNPGSDLQGAGWLQTVHCRGFEDIRLQHLYRTAAYFLEPVRSELERELFLHDRDLFSLELDLVLIDTTSTYVWRDQETPLRKRGHSKDRRPDQPQVVICVAVDRDGWPIAWDILPGNTADARSLQRMIATLRSRLSIRQVIVVADRGMMSKATIKLLTEHEDAPFDYILGSRMRRQKEVNEAVLGRAGRYRTVAENLDVKEVMVDDRRYVVCRNPIEQRKDAASREAILGKLEETLSSQGPKAVIGNKGFARFLKVARGSVTIDDKAVRADERLDGKFVLQTNCDLPAADVAQAYKSLWRVERTFREAKSTLEIRPIYHQKDEATIGHIVACFLALRLEVDLQRRLDARKTEVSWPDLMRDLDQVRAVSLTLDGEHYLLRTDLQGAAHEAFAAAGVRPPPAVTRLGPSDDTLGNVVPNSYPHPVTCL